MLFMKSALTDSFSNSCLKISVSTQNYRDIYVQSKLNKTWICSDSIQLAEFILDLFCML